MAPNDIDELPLLELLKNSQACSLVSTGVRLRALPVPMRMEDGKIICQADDAQTLVNIRHSPRVAFTSLTDNSNHSVWGNGIARTQPGSIIIEPYRIERAYPQKEVFEFIRGTWKKADPSGDSSLQSRKGIAFWLKASRAVSFPLAALSVLAGAFFGFNPHHFNVLIAFLSVIGGVAALAGANLISDYQDFRSGVDTLNALSSHTGALAREEADPVKILVAGFSALSIVALCGVLLVGLTGWPVLLFGITGLLGCIFYTMGPFAYKYEGFGEIGIFFLMGPLMFLGSYFVQHQKMTFSGLLLSVAIGMLTASVSMANNLRDMVHDARAGLQTLPMRIGVANTKRFYGFLTFLPFLLCAFVMFRQRAWSLGLPLLALPNAFIAMRAMVRGGTTSESIRASAPVFRYPLNSIRLHFRFGLLLIAGEIAGHFL